MKASIVRLLDGEARRVLVAQPGWRRSSRPRQGAGDQHQQVHRQHFGERDQVVVGAGRGEHRLLHAAEEDLDQRVVAFVPGQQLVARAGSSSRGGGRGCRHRSRRPRRCRRGAPPAGRGGRSGCGWHAASGRRRRRRRSGRRSSPAPKARRAGRRLPGQGRRRARCARPARRAGHRPRTRPSPPWWCGLRQEPWSSDATCGANTKPGVSRPG